MVHLKQIQIIDPLISAKGVTDQLAQRGIAEGQPPAGGDTVGLVLEPLGPEVGKVLEDGVLDDLAMDSCHTVDRVTSNNGEVCHAHKPVKASQDSMRVP